MAAPGIEPDNAMAARLTALLQRARALKQSISIDPPLQVSELLSDSESLLGHATGTKDNQMLAVDRAAKNIFYGKVVWQLNRFRERRQYGLHFQGFNTYLRTIVCRRLEST